MANAVSSGLCAHLFTADMRRAWRIAAALQVGMVGISESAISTEVAPFGGVKDSGYGREGSRHGLDDYLHSSSTSRWGRWKSAAESLSVRR